MKKFLTVLLALSVVFTYTVGSAFAGTVAAQSDTTPYDVAMTNFEAKATTITAKNAETQTYEAGAVTYALGEARLTADAVAKILINKHTNSEGTLDAAAFYTDFDGWLNRTTTVTDPTTGTVYDCFDNIYAKKVVAKDVELKVEAAKTLVENVKAADYIEEDRAKVEAYKTTVLDALKVVVEKDNPVRNLFSQNEYPGQDVFKQVKDYGDIINIYLYGAESKWTIIYTADSKDSEIANAKIKGFFGALSKLTTIAEDEENDKVTAEYIKTVMANLSFNVKVGENGFYNTYKVAAGDTVAKTDAGIKIASAVNVYGVEVAKASKITAAEATAINNALMAQIETTLKVAEESLIYTADDYTKAQLLAIIGQWTNNAIVNTAMEKALKASAFFAKVEAYGADMKDDVNYIGEKMYSDEDIDAAIADAKEEIYSKYYADTFGTVVSAYFNQVRPSHDPVAVALRAASAKFDKLISTDKVAEADKKYCRDFYSASTTPVDWQDEYAEIKSDAQKALNEVKSIEEVDAIMADADAKLAKLRTKADETAALTAGITKYQEALDEYKAEQWKLVEDTKKYSSDSFDDALAEGKKLIASVAKADDLATAYADAKSLFNDIKTIEELDNQAAVVEKLIVALPDKVTLDKDAEFMAAYDAYMAYLENFGAKKVDVTGYYALETMMDKLVVLQKEAVTKAINALAALAPIKADDKAAVSAAREMYDKYYDYYDQYSAPAFVISPLTLQMLTDAEDDVYFDEIEVVKYMVSKLTASSPITDIKAAKEAFDALSGSQQRLVEKAYPYKYEMLLDRLISSVESLKIKTSTKLYTKSNKIRVNWKVVDGDASVADGYYVYKSTKAQTGYKFMGKTTKNYMDNKKNLKKGKRYFYKVKAYVEIDGVKYFSDDSNKGNRIYK